MKALCVIWIVAATTLSAADYKALNDKGVKAYRQEQYDSSLKYFEGALKLKPDEKVIDFNLGNVYHQEGQFEDALKSYESAALAGDTALAAASQYNMGNTFFRSGEYDKAVDAYKRALAFRSEDKDAKYNLELALRKLEEQQKQQQQQQKQDQQQQDQQNQQKQQGQDQKQQDQQQQKQGQQEQPKDQQNQDQNKNQEQQQQDQPGNQNQPQPGDSVNAPPEQRPNAEQPTQLDRERARALLDGFSQDEKDVMEKLIREKIEASGYSGKKW